MAADWLNYHHLLYFWTVAREGSISAACEQLHLAQPTISGQLRKLEQRVGGKLYQRIDRKLVLTELGQTVFKYADEMFTIGQELSEVLQGQPTGRPLKLNVGVPEVLPKLIAYRLLEPALQMADSVQLVCHEAPQSQLLARLASHELDVVFSDAPAGSFTHIRAFNHMLGECGVGVFGTSKLLKQFAHSPPHSLYDAPFLLPAPGTALRRSLDQWLLQTDVPVRVVAEFDDTALMKVFAEADHGFIPAPLVIEEQLQRQFNLERLCVIPDAKEQFYAITVERKLRHPAVVVISEFAQTKLFHQRDAPEQV